MNLSDQRIKLKPLDMMHDGPSPDKLHCTEGSTPPLRGRSTADVQYLILLSLYFDSVSYFSITVIEDGVSDPSTVYPCTCHHSIPIA